MKKLAGLRSRYPILRRSRFLSGEVNEQLGIREVTWINVTGGEMQDEHWHDDHMLCFGMVLDGRAQATGIRQRGQDATILIIFNAYHDVVSFTLPQSAEPARWRLLIDTSRADPHYREHGFASGDVYDVTGRSLLMFSMEPASAATSWPTSEK